MNQVTGVTASVMPPLAAGLVVGPWRLGRELGRGRFHAVHDAVHTRGGHHAALKVLKLPPESPEMRKRLSTVLTQVATWRASGHHHLVRQLDEGTVDHPHLGPLAYLAVEFLEGASWSGMTRALGPVTPAVAARLLWQAASGLESLHGRGQFHGALSPGNVMYARGCRVVLTEGAMTRLHLRMYGSGASMRKETLIYRAPECAAGQAPDVRSDVYALGALLLHLLTADHPGAESAGGAVFGSATAWEARSTGDGSSLVKGQVREVMHRAMAIKPEARFASAREFGEALLETVTSLPFTELPPLDSVVSKLSGAAPRAPAPPTVRAPARAPAARPAVEAGGDLALPNLLPVPEASPEVPLVSGHLVVQAPTAPVGARALPGLPDKPPPPPRVAAPTPLVSSQQQLLSEDGDMEVDDSLRAQLKGTGPSRPVARPTCAWCGMSFESSGALATHKASCARNPDGVSHDEQEVQLASTGAQRCPHCGAYIERADELAVHVDRCAMRKGPSFAQMSEEALQLGSTAPAGHEFAVYLREVRDIPNRGRAEICTRGLDVLADISRLLADFGMTHKKFPHLRVPLTDAARAMLVCARSTSVSSQKHLMGVVDALITASNRIAEALPPEARRRDPAVSARACDPILRSVASVATVAAGAASQGPRAG